MQIWFRMCIDNVKVNFTLEQATKAQSSTLSLTLALDGGGWSVPRPGRFSPGMDPVPIVQETGLAQGRSGWVRKISAHWGSIPGSSTL